MQNNYYIYILTNATNTVLYTGVTNDLKRRVHEHKEMKREGFTKRYKCGKLVYCEHTGNINSAIAREKQIKAGSRKRKIALINSMNPNWLDLFEII